MMGSCPCSPTKPYESCCGQYIEKGLSAPTPETLMRSRYSAFVKKNIAYIMNTMRDAAALDFDAVSLSTWLDNVSWINLNVVQSQMISPDKGTVSFIARYTFQGQQETIAEKSEFKKIDNHWYYVNGIHPKQGQPCLCLSGKKFKHCCGISK